MDALPVVVEDAEDLGRTLMSCERMRNMVENSAGWPGLDQDSALARRHTTRAPAR